VFEGSLILLRKTGPEERTARQGKTEQRFAG